MNMDQSTYELVAIHNEKMTKRFDMVLEGTIADKYEIYEHNINKEQNPAKSSAQECVEDRSKTSSIMLASVRNTHKRSKDNKPIKGGRAHRRTYAQVATPGNE